MKFIYAFIGSFIMCLFATAQPKLHSDSSKNFSTSDSIFSRVEYESEFPGGSPGWIQFLNSNLKYPDKAVDRLIQGTVVVQFIVGKDGSLSEIRAISGPALLREAAVAALLRSPIWNPATQNGRVVKSYKKQPITFRLVK